MLYRRAKIGPKPKNSRPEGRIPKSSMRTICLISAITILASHQTLQAGLYLPAQPSQAPEIIPQGMKPVPFSLFRPNVLEDLLQIGSPQLPESKIRQEFLAARSKLQAKARTEELTEEEKVNLSGYLIWLRQYQEAVDLLTPVATRECRNFMIFANLATAEQQAGQLERAVNHLEQAQDVWPQEWPKLSAEQLRWYRRAEKYHLILLRHRWTQARRSAPAQPELDPLFTKEGQPVRYLGDDGRYEAGKIAAAERAKLPSDAISIVQQLLMWLPEDTLLYWQYGELLNAQGDVVSAARVFDDCVWRRRLDNPELKQHRQIVTEAAQAKTEGSDLASEQGEKASAPVTESSWLPDRNKLWAAGTVFALIVVVLVYFQVREIRRRRAPLSRE
jgi:tetratricopeptide (TPR) repeat protein